MKVIKKAPANGLWSANRVKGQANEKLQKEQGRTIGWANVNSKVNGQSAQLSDWHEEGEKERGKVR